MKSHVSLFAGIGAMDIAAEHAGYTTAHCVEIDPWCRSVLALRFPGAEMHADVRTVGAAELGTGMDLLSGGFPCQDLSSAGKRAGLDGGRSGLWFEYLRIIGECRPKTVLIENVAVLKSRGLDVVIAGLAAKGYGCWWDCVHALAVGAPHLRDRIWITAVPFGTMPQQAAFCLLPGSDAPYRMVGPNGKMPRAGMSRAGGRLRYVYELAPQATIKAAKLAMGAERRADGVTWLTSIDSPLFPTPSASSYGSNRGGAAGRVGPVRQSLTSMARSGEWPTPCFPTPTVGDSRNSRNATATRAPGGKHHAGTTLSDFMRLWPTPRASANELRATREAPSHGSTHGRVLAGVVCDLERQDGRAVSPPSQSAGSLNPTWVEWLMGLPIGWTSLDCSSPVQLDFRDGEPDIPRVAAGVVERKQRLMACGNALVWQVAATRLEQATQLLGAL